MMNERNEDPNQRLPEGWFWYYPIDYAGSSYEQYIQHVEDPDQPFEWTVDVMPAGEVPPPQEPPPLVIEAQMQTGPDHVFCIDPKGGRSAPDHIEFVTCTVSLADKELDDWPRYCHIIFNDGTSGRYGVQQDASYAPYVHAHKMFGDN